MISPALIGAIAGSRRRSASAGITQDAKTTNKQTTGNPSFAHSQGSVTNGCATVILCWTKNTATAVTGVTYGGGAMTQVAEAVRVSSYFVTLFKLDLGTSASGSKTVAVTFNGTVTSSMATVVTHSGVKQATSFTVGTANSFSGTPTVTIATTAATELVVGGAAGGGAVTSQDTAYDSYTPSSGYGSAYAAGTGGNVVLDWTSANIHWAVAAEVLQAA